MNQNCQKIYDFKIRKQQTEKYSGRNTSHLYCSDLCWAVSTKGIEEATKEIIVVK
jgi:hypothetical protein